MDPYTAQQLELLHKLQLHQLTSYETVTLILTTLLLPLPADWRFHLYFFLTSPDKFFSNLQVDTPVMLVLGVLLAAFTIYLLVQLILLKRLLKKPLVILEITPPHDSAQSAFSTEQLFVLLHNLARQKGNLEKFFRQKKTYSLEIVATRDRGIRYLLSTRFEEADLLSRSIRAYLPGVQIHEVDDYLTAASPGDLMNKQGQAKLLSFTLSNHFVLPLRKQKILDEHDPIAYITGNMTQLEPGELISWQLVLSPVDRNTHFWKHREITKIGNLILNGGDVFAHLAQRSGPWYSRLAISLISSLFKLFVLGVYLFILLPLTFVLQAVAAVTSDGKNPGPALPPIPFLSQVQTKVQLNSYQHEVQNQIQEKIGQELFESSVRLLLLTSSHEELERRERGIISSLATLANPSWQSLKLNSGGPLFVSNWVPVKRLCHFFFRERLLGLSNNPVLSVSEIADIYHFPQLEFTNTEGLLKSKSKVLPAPLSMKRSDSQLDVILGKNSYGGKDNLLGLTLPQRRKHMYILGKTGAGKTTLLESMIHQDMQNGKGLMYIDPHGDSFKRLLRVVPEHRRKDVIILNPADRQFPFGLNILSPGIDFADVEEGQEWISSATISVFLKLTDKEYWGPRLEHILRNTVLTALETKNPQLYVIQKLLTTIRYQKIVAKDLTDPILKQFWAEEFSLMGTMQQSSAISPITHRIGKFITNKMSRHILLQEKSTINIQQAMDEGKIILVNLAKGELGEDVSSFFGSVLLSLVQLCAYQRLHVEEESRRDFFVYVDEFQNFATPTFSEMFSEGRKFRVGYILSHQDINQIEDLKGVKTIAGNSGTVAVFQASPDDEAFILPFMDPEVEKGEIVNLLPHHFFMKVNSSESEDAFSGQTVPLTVEGSLIVADEVTEYTRAHYTTPREMMEKQIAEMITDIDNQIKGVSKETGPKNTNTTDTKPTNGHNGHKDEINPNKDIATLPAAPSRAKKRGIS